MHLICWHVLYGGKCGIFFLRVETINGTALAGEDYKPYDKVVEFKKKEALREVYIEIVDDFEWEPDEFFFVKLKTETPETCVLGQTSICEVTIINDDGKRKPCADIKKIFISLLHC